MTLDTALTGAAFRINDLKFALAKPDRRTLLRAGGSRCFGSSGSCAGDYPSWLLTLIAPVSRQNPVWAYRNVIFAVCEVEWGRRNHRLHGDSAKKPTTSARVPAATNAPQTAGYSPLRDDQAKLLQFGMDLGSALRVEENATSSRPWLCPPLPASCAFRSTMAHVVVPPVWSRRPGAA